MTLEPVSGVGAGSKHSIMSASASGSAVFEEDIMSAEEFDYPKTTK